MYAPQIDPVSSNVEPSPEAFEEGRSERSSRPPRVCCCQSSEKLNECFAQQSFISRQLKRMGFVRSHSKQELEQQFIRDLPLGVMTSTKLSPDLIELAGRNVNTKEPLVSCCSAFLARSDQSYRPPVNHLRPSWYSADPKNPNARWVVGICSRSLQ